MAAIRLRKIHKVNENPAPTAGYITINCASWFQNNVFPVPEVRRKEIGDTIPLYQLSAFPDPETGCFFQNVYHGSKTFRKVEKQDQPERVGGWKHPEEVHVDEKGNVLPAYWAWRKKVFTHKNPVRYPNGYQGRDMCLGSLWQENGKWELLNYFEARRKIYVALYTKWVKETKAYKQLKALVDAGMKLELLGIECPASIEFSMDNFNLYLNQLNPRFGFTWSLAACLLGHL